jgi:RNA polymerase sigma factor (sigma-70 family)
LHDRHGRAVLRYCRRHLSSREEAEDATQIVFFNAYRSLERGVDPHAEQAWLFKIAEHVVMYRRRTISRRARVEFPSDLGRFADSIAAPRDPARPELAGLEAALGRVPDAQRRAIVLREWHGLSHREVAAELGITRTAAETLIFRARRRLATELSEPDGGREKTKRNVLSLVLSLLWMKWAGFGSGAKVAAGLMVATTVAGSLDHGALLRLTAPQMRPAIPRPALVGRARRATIAHGSVEAGARRTVRAFRVAVGLPATHVVAAVVGATPLPAVVEVPPAVAISDPISPVAPAGPPDPAVDDRGTDAVTGDPNPPRTGDPVVAPPAASPAAAGLAARPGPVPQAGGDSGGTPAPCPASQPGNGVGPKHPSGDPTLPSRPPTASPAAQTTLACRPPDDDGRNLAAAGPDNAGAGTRPVPASAASDPSWGDAAGATDRKGDPPAAAVVANDRLAVPDVAPTAVVASERQDQPPWVQRTDGASPAVKRGGDALLGGGVK